MGASGYVRETQDTLQLLRSAHQYWQCDPVPSPLPLQSIYPWRGYEGYMHLRCALQEAAEQGRELQPPVCKHWSTKGYCLFKANCFYLHPPEAAAKVRLEDPAELRAINAVARKANRGQGRRNLVRNSFRAGTMRRFLLETFGRDALAAGSGVLDVAGGKGELSFELLNLNGVPATVVEPRTLQLARQHVMLQKGYYWRNPHFRRSIDTAPAQFACGQAGRNPPHLRMVLDAAAVRGVVASVQQQQQQQQGVRQPGAPVPPAAPAGPSLVQQPHMASRHAHAPSLASMQPEAEDVAASTRAARTQHHAGTGASGTPAAPAAVAAQQQAGASMRGPAPSWPDVFHASLQQAQDLRWTHHGLEHGDDLEHAQPGCNAAESIGSAQSLPPAVGPTDITGAAEALSILANCSVIIGIHPDQAVESIVDLAEQLQKPFAVVPCCVHPSEFPQRRVDGQHVRSYDQLLAYLQQRAPRSRVQTLPFEGRNKVVYCTDWSEAVHS